MNNIRKRNLIAAVIISVLLVIAISSIFRLDGSNSQITENETITVKVGEQVLGVVTLDEIRQMPSVRRKLIINSSDGSSEHDFRGTLLVNVLNKIDPQIVQTYHKVQTVGVDDYMSDMTMAEVLQENNVYVMYADNEQPIPTKNGNGSSMRLIVLYDAFGQRFTNYLVEIIVE